MSTMNIFDLTDAWNAAGTTFTAIKMNVTDTASAADSLLLDLQVGGSSRFSVTKAGGIAVPDGSATVPALRGADTNSGIYFSGNNTRISCDGTLLFAFGGNGDFDMRSSAQIRWTSGADPSINHDTILARDAANVVAQRNGTNTQTERIYSTYTSSTNYQRMTLTSARTTLSGLGGASVTATNLIPDGAVVVGVTARVTTEITGSTGFLIGTAGDPDRWGDITGTAVGTTSDNRDWTAGTIECFTSTSDVVITAKTSNFTAGAVEIAIHYLAGEAD